MNLSTQPSELKTLKPRAGAILAPVTAALVCVVAFGLVALACPAEAQQPPSGKGAIRGVVVTAEESTPVEGAEVSLRESGSVVRTAGDGSFVIRGLGPGVYALEIQHTGFYPVAIEVISVSAGETTEVSAKLKRLSFLKEVVVTPSLYSLYRENPESRTSLSREAVTQIPHMGDDVFRAIERLPGAAGEEVSAQINIRGGEVNEVKVVLDGLEIFEAFHLKHHFSIFSIVDAEAIGGLDMMTGGFPVEYGNRMSGVIDIKSSTPRGGMRTTLGLSTTNSGVLSEGTFNEGQGEWLVSARRTFLDIVMDWIDPDNGFDPSFVDLFAHVQMPLGDRSVLAFNAMGLKDKVRYQDFVGDSNVVDEDLDASSKGRYAWMNLKTSWANDLYSETVFSYGGVEHSRLGWIETGSADADVQDERSFDFFGLKQDWSLGLFDRQFLKWGFEVRRFDAEYDYHSWAINRDFLWTGWVPKVTENDIELQPTGNQYGAYVADRIQISDSLVAEVGVRWDEQTWADDNQISPRLNLAYMFGQNTALRLACGTYHQPQYIHELQVQDRVSEFVPAQRADHYLVGFEHSFSKGYDVRVEAYYKDYSEVIPRYENQLNPIEILPEVEPDRILVAPDSAQAKGVELMLKHNGKGPWNWWFSYAYATAEDEINGEWVPRSWDQPHTANFSVNYKPSPAWNFNLAGIYHTGWPTTGVEAGVRYLPDGSRYIIAWLGPRNAERYDDYMRFDFRASRRFQLRRSELMLFLEVINLTNRENIGRVDSFGFRIHPDGSHTINMDREYYFPIIPSFGLRWSF